MKIIQSLSFPKVARGVSFALMVILLVHPAWAAEEPNLMERWLVSDSLSKRDVDHSPWQTILNRYLVVSGDGVNSFDYGAVSKADREALTRYIAMLGRVDVDRLNRNEQMAFWINAYNALVVSIVLEDYPVRSINDIGGSFFSPGPWKEKRFRVYLINLSLNDIYHRILRPIWADIRVHYALGCGARGCAQLAAKPYAGKTIEEDLERAQSAFINHGPAILQIKETGVTLSRIFDWYGEDFGDREEDILARLRQQAGGDMAAKLAPVSEISSYGFDWDLNDAPGEPRED